jgi:glutamine cyclotransferase
MRRSLLLAITLLFALTSAQAQTPVYGYKVVATFPHATSSYTEGFFYLNGLFYEGTGMKGHSQVLVIEPATGQVVKHLDLDPQYFGEGIVDWGANLYEWTWQAHLGFVYNRTTLQRLATFTYTGEGWGMTHDSAHIITDDGTAVIRFRDPKDFHEVRNILVTDQGAPSKAKSTPTSGTPTASPASLPATATSSPGSIAPASSRPCSNSTPKPSSTASPTTPSTTASSSPAKNGPPSSRSN